MINDYTVKIIYADKNGYPIQDRHYNISDYCYNEKKNILSVIGDIQNLIKYMNNNIWDDNTKQSYQKIRHKLLDAANDVSRLPNNICYKGSRINQIPLSQIAK